MTALVALTIVMLVPGAEPVPLQWKLAEGDVFYTKGIGNTSSTVTVNGREVAKEKEQITWFKYTVNGSNENGYVIDRMTEKSETNGKPTSIAGGSWNGVVVTFTLNKKYQVTKVVGIEKGILKVAGDNEELRKVMLANMTPEALAPMFETMFRAVPNTPVKIDDKWTRTFHQTLGAGMGSLKIDAEYKYAQRELAIDKITYRGAIKYIPVPEVPDAPLKITKAEFTVDEYGGEYIFDSKLGRLKSMTHSSKINGKLTYAAKDKDFEGTFKETIKSSITISDKSLAKD